MTDARRFSIEEIAAYFAVPAEALGEAKVTTLDDVRRWIEAEERRLLERFLGVADGYLERSRP